MKQPSAALIFGRVLAVLILTVLLYLVYIAAQWGLADVYSRQVINDLKDWRRGNLVLKAEDWNTMQSKLEKALALDPKNPKLYEYAGLAVEGPYVNNPIKDETAKPHRLKAKDYYAKSIQLRPSWPFVWSDFALVKFRLGEIDKAFYHALYRSDELGPWEPSVQHTAIVIGLAYWGLLSIEDRKFILAVIDKSMKHAERSHSLRVLNVIKRYDFLELYCFIESEIKFVQNFCEKNLK